MEPLRSSSVPRSTSPDRTVSSSHIPFDLEPPSFLENLDLSDIPGSDFDFSCLEDVSESENRILIEKQDVPMTDVFQIADQTAHVTHEPYFDFNNVQISADDHALLPDLSEADWHREHPTQNNLAPVSLGFVNNTIGDLTLDAALQFEAHHIPWGQHQFDQYCLNDIQAQNPGYSSPVRLSEATYMPTMLHEPYLTGGYPTIGDITGAQAWPNVPPLISHSIAPPNPSSDKWQGGMGSVFVVGGKRKR
ncbi:hypothetical protein FDENT_9951 [Fusarium denticulatum]|uniref:Uncharacterized protein n=1 Tax=Fusarium denticulatum TaxID=48507 RepID=A0A8H5TM10_9HYPO|nr:hypothetical protein FDENT_9951 [Fusarium denticulatum]